MVGNPGPPRPDPLGVTSAVRPALAPGRSVPSSLVRRLLRPVLPLAVLVAAFAGCGGDEAPTSAPADCTRIEGDRYTLVAENLAWNTECLRVAAGTDVTFTVDLRDSSVDHNLAISGPSGKAETPLERGPKQQTLEYPATTPGYHQFVCDIHPSMEGDLWVDPPPRP